MIRATCHSGESRASVYRRAPRKRYRRREASTLYPDIPSPSNPTQGLSEALGVNTMSFFRNSASAQLFREVAERKGLNVSLDLFALMIRPFVDMQTKVYPLCSGSIQVALRGSTIWKYADNKLTLSPDPADLASWRPTVAIRDREGRNIRQIKCTTVDRAYRAGKALASIADDLTSEGEFAQIVSLLCEGQLDREDNVLDGYDM